MSTRFRIIYLYFKNSHNFVSLIKKNQYPSFSNCFSIIFPLYQRNRVINFESSTYSHNSVPLILNQNKKGNQFTYSLTHYISLISRKNHVVNSAAFEQPNLRPRENYLPKVSTTIALRERKKKKKGNTCDRKGVNGAVPSNN